MTRVADEVDFLSDLPSSEEDDIFPAHNIYSEANFYRQVQSSILIGHVLDLVSVLGPHSEQGQSRFRLLDSQLRRAIQITLDFETGKLDSVSEALAMNRRYRPGHPGSIAFLTFSLAL